MTDLSSKIDHVKSDAKRFGWLRSLDSRLFRFASHYLGIHVHVVRITEMIPNPTFPSDNSYLEYRQVGADELYAASEDPEMGLSRKFVEAAIERGDLAFGAFDGSRMVSFVWRSETAAPHDGNIWVRVKPPYCYAYKSFTRPSHRGQRICPGVQLCSDQSMLERGYKYRVGFVEITNWASLAMGKHMRSQIIGKAGYLMLFGKCITFSSKAVKAIGFEFFDRTSPHSVN